MDHMTYQNITILSVLAVLSGCTIMPTEDHLPCGKGLTRLDGTCVSQEIANYVSCVRAQASQFGSEKNRILAAEVGTIGTQASGASDFSDRIYRSFGTSDKVIMVIIKHCNEKTSTKAVQSVSMLPESSACQVNDKSQKTSSLMQYQVNLNSSEGRAPMVQTRSINFPKKYKTMQKKEVCPLC
jgi:hypothetical protein